MSNDSHPDISRQNTVLPITYLSYTVDLRNKLRTFRKLNIQHKKRLIPPISEHSVYLLHQTVIPCQLRHVLAVAVGRPVRCPQGTKVLPPPICLLVTPELRFPLVSPSLIVSPLSLSFSLFISKSSLSSCCAFYALSFSLVYRVAHFIPTPTDPHRYRSRSPGKFPRQFRSLTPQAESRAPWESGTRCRACGSDQSASPPQKRSQKNCSVLSSWFIFKQLPQFKLRTMKGAEYSWTPRMPPAVIAASIAG